MSNARRLQLLQLEFDNGNFHRAYELADNLILTSTDDIEIAAGWMYKGLSAASLSSVSKERLVEGVSFIQEAQKYQIKPEVLLVIGEKLSKIVLSHVIKLSQYYSASLKERLHNQRGRVQPHPTESVSEYAARRAVQEWSDSIKSADRQRKGSVELGQHFEQYHSSAIVTALTYAFDLTHGSVEVTQDIAKVIEIIIDATSLMPMARRRFRDAMSPLVGKLWDLYPNVLIYQLKETDELSCPNCGYTFIQKEKTERGCLFIGIMTILTLGVYLFSYLLDSILSDGKKFVTTAKEGEHLICETCGHQWIY